MNVIKCIELSKKYDQVLALSKVNLNVERGEFFALLGPNGAGKTTLVSQIFGQIFPDSGQIFFQDINVRKGFCYVFCFNHANNSCVSSKLSNKIKILL